ncbi:MAG: hypothetical protein U0175_13725 [Caldilineaceae bacterium]
MQSFGELLTEYMKRTGISDSELARSIGVQRQTIFRWKEGSVARPRLREDVLNCAARLRLSAEERDLLLLSAGFPPESPTAVQSEAQSSAIPSLTPKQSTPQQNTEEIYPDPPEKESPTLDSIVKPLNDKTIVPPFRPSLLLRWGWLVGGLAILALIAIQLPRWLRTVDLPTPTPVQVVVDTPPTETPSPTPLPTPTIEPARSGEQLIIIAEFDNRAVNQGYNMAGRLKEAITSEVSTNHLSDVRTVVFLDVLKSEESAQTLQRQTKAALVIWGEYDSGRVVIRYADRNRPSQLEQTVQTPDQLPVRINNDTPREVKALALATLGQVYRRAGDQAKAKTVLTLALDQKPETVDIRARSLFYLARISEDGGCNGSAEQPQELAACDQAIEDYTQLIALDPSPAKDWINAWYNRGNAYTNRSKVRAKDAPEIVSDLDAAIADYGVALQILPNYAKALLNRGTAYYERNQEGDLASALADFEQALQNTSNQSELYFMHGLTLLRQSATSDWESDFLKAQQLAPKDTSVHIALCWGYVVSQQLPKAQTECEQARQLSNNDPAHADLQALLLAQTGDLAGSLQAAKAHLTWIQSQPKQLYERLNGSLVEEWIAELAQGKNPFDVALLDQLRRGK